MSQCIAASCRVLPLVNINTKFRTVIYILFHIYYYGLSKHQIKYVSHFTYHTTACFPCDKTLEDAKSHLDLAFLLGDVVIIHNYVTKSR